jgi:hypothetical protein
MCGIVSKMTRLICLVAYSHALADTGRTTVYSIRNKTRESDANKGPTRGPTKAMMKGKGCGEGEREVRVPCTTNSKSLQHVQRAYAVYQLV